MISCINIRRWLYDNVAYGSLEAMHRPVHLQLLLV